MVVWSMEPFHEKLHTTSGLASYPSRRYKANQTGTHCTPKNNKIILLSRPN